jgi:hypothetical protein
MNISIDSTAANKSAHSVEEVEETASSAYETLALEGLQRERVLRLAGNSSFQHREFLPQQRKKCQHVISLSALPKSVTAKASADLSSWIEMITRYLRLRHSFS